MIEQVLRVLGAAGLPLDYRDLADVLWLAELMPRVASPPEPLPIGQTPAAHQPTTERASTPHLHAVLPTERRRVRISSGTVLRDEQDLFATAPRARTSSTGIRVSRVRVPTAPGLHDAIAIARAMRPLARRFPSRHAEVLDEEATAERSAETGMLTPVFRPARERWFEVALVVEDVPSMALWRRVIAEFHRLLQQQGAFRDVRRWTLSFSEGKAHVIDPAGAARPTRELRDPEARRLILVVSDCVSPAWYGRTMASLLADWGVTTPVAVLQLLPDHLWAKTALGASRARFGASAPGIPNAQLFVERPWWDDDPITGQLPLPVLTLDAPSIGEWSRMLMGLGVRARGIIVGRHLLPATAIGDAVPEAAVPPADVDARVERFRSLVSLDAYRLAMYLAVVPLTLPVIRLVHAAMFAQPNESRLAEVLLGGIIERVTPADAKASDDEVEYEFAATADELAEARGSGMRNTLLRSITRSDAHRVLAAVSRYVSDRVGSTVDFGAWVRSATGTETLPESARPFARLADATMRRLGNAVTEASVVRVSAGPAAGGAETIEVEEEVFAAGLTVMKRVALAEPAHQIAWSPNGDFIALRNEYGIVVLGAKSGAEILRVQQMTTVTAMVWSQNSSEIAFTTRSQEEDLLRIYVHPVFVRFEPAGRSTLATEFRTHGEVVDMDWRGPFNEIALGMSDGRVLFWQQGKDTLLESPELRDRPGIPVRALSWSNDASKFVVLYGDGELTSGNSAERRDARSEGYGSPSATLAALAWDPLSRWVAVARKPARVDIMSGSEVQPLVELEAAWREVTSLSFSRDGDLLTAVAGDEVIIWRTADWMRVIQRPLADATTQGVVAAFSPSAHVLAYTTNDSLHLLRVDADTLTTTLVLDEPAPPTPEEPQAPRPIGTECAVIVAVAGKGYDLYAQGVADAAHKFYDWFKGRTVDLPRLTVVVGPPSLDFTLTPPRPPTLSGFQGALEEAVSYVHRSNNPNAAHRLYVYVAGLGGRLPRGDRVVFVDGEGSGDRVPIPVNQYMDALAHAQAFDDVIFFGDFEDDMMTREYEIPAWSPSVSVPALPDAREATQVAIHSGTYSTGENAWAFTDAIVAGLSGAAANDDGNVTTQSLWSYLRADNRLVRARHGDGGPSVDLTIKGGTGELVLAHVEPSTGGLRIWADDIFEGRTLRVRDDRGTEVLSYTSHAIGGEGPDFHALPIGNYIADVVGLPVDVTFHVSPPDTQSADVRLEWTPTGIRVLIVGTGKMELSPAEAMASEQLGRALAQGGHSLVAGGWPGVDHVVAREYAKYLALQHLPLEQYLTQVLEGPRTPDFEGGNVIELSSVGEDFGESLRYADVVVVIGGLGGARRIVRMALDRSIVVIPWAATGGAAEKAMTQIDFGAEERWQWLTEPLSDPARVAELADRLAATVSQLIGARRQAS